MNSQSIELVVVREDGTETLRNNKTGSKLAEITTYRSVSPDGTTTVSVTLTPISNSGISSKEVTFKQTVKPLITKEDLEKFLGQQIAKQTSNLFLFVDLDSK